LRKRRAYISAAYGNKEKDARIGRMYFLNQNKSKGKYKED
jgi:hypothetical protein